jgi:hypothetical protein
VTTTLTPDELELLHDEIDGMNSPERSALASALLERSGEARRQHAQLEMINAAIARIERATPPDTLRPAILRVVAPRSTAARPRRRVAPGWPVTLGYAASFVLGIAAVWPVSTVRDVSDPASTAQMVGTLARSAPDVTVDSWSIASAGVAGRFEMVRRQGRPVVELNLDSSAPVRVTLDCGSGCRDMQGFVRRSGAESELHSDEGRLTIVTSGHYEATILVGEVAAGEAAVDVRLVAGYGPEHKGTLRFRTAGGP